MNTMKRYILAFAALAVSTLSVYSQSEEYFERLLQREQAVENPQYMPIIGGGIGFFNYYGNINNSFKTTASQPGYRLNVSMFLSQQKERQFLRANVFFLTGNLTGSQRYVPTISDLDNFDAIKYENLSFRSNITSFGANLQYNFNPQVKKRILEPFVSLGGSFLQFNTKTDFSSVNGAYYYWTDGTIRDLPQNSDDWRKAKIVPRNYSNEQHVRSNTNFALAVPVELGFEFNVAPRFSFRVASSLNFAFTDWIDGMSDVADYKGKRNISMFTFSYVSLHFDLFSDPEMELLQLLFAEVDSAEFDEYSFYDDDDGDDVFDFLDMCPNTPFDMGIEVYDYEHPDSAGCPVDSDGDGIPDYLDREPNSRPGAIVDEYGVEITEEEFLEKLSAQAIRRSEVEAFLLMQRVQNRTTRRGDLPIPDKFRRIDINSDGYISFDEFLRAINDFFDGSSNLTPNDLRELNDFFFEQ